MKKQKLLNPKNLLHLAMLSGLLLTQACSPTAPQFQSLLAEQPYVAEFSPGEGSALDTSKEIVIKLSERININQITSDSVTLVSGIKDHKLLEQSRELVDQIEEGNLQKTNLKFLLDADEKTLTIKIDEELNDGIYYLVVTPKLQSVYGIPFNQKPGQSPTAFIAKFIYGNPLSLEEAEKPGESDAQVQNPASFGVAPESLVINEVLYDGLESETDGEAFVELYGTPGADISLYQVLLINGADGSETDRITLPMNSVISEDGLFVIADLKTNSTNETYVESADFLDQFDPQNGPDGFQLIDREGKLVDSVVYGEGAVAQSKKGLALGEGSFAPDVAGGHSLSRVNGVDSNNNAEDFTDLETPTPGVI